MKSFIGLGPAVGVAALFAGCALRQTQGDTQPPVVMLQASAVAEVRSWTAADATTKDLLYTVYPTVVKQGTIDLYSYPQGVLEGQISGLNGPGGDCSDKKGNVYVTDVEPSGNEVVEFAHGGTQPIRTLSVPSGRNPYSCAVDPATGDLAVTNYGNTAGDGASLLIYRRAKGQPRSYTDPQFLNYAYCTYDNSGDLFVDGKYPGGYEVPIFGEIPRGAKSIETINLNYEIGWISGLQWDGKYLAVGQGVKPYIFQFLIAGTSGTRVGSTPLSDATWLEQFVLAGKRVVAVNIFFHDRYEYEYDVLLYNYPQGGNSTGKIGYDIGGGDISSVALSRKKRSVH
ncbi:MAG: hypothetical protein WCC84_01375 [Candidatus Cybelea sp.]